MNEGQKRAIDHVLNSNDQVIIVSGGAGTGKTSLLKEVKWGIEDQGMNLFAVAPSANASRGVLRDKGFEDANTIAALLQKQTLQDKAKDGVILVDEAGMVGNKTMTRLFEVAEQQNARIILSGDWYQHNSPEAGDALRILEQKAGVSIGRVTDVVRQKDEDYKQAVTALSEGETDKGFETLDKMKSIIEIKDKKKRYERVAQDYITSLEKDRSALVVSPTHKEGQGVSDVIRAALKDKGLIKGNETAFQTRNSLSLTRDQKQNAKGYKKDMSVQFFGEVDGFERGDFYDFKGHDKAGQVIVKGADGEQLVLPLSEARKFQVFENNRTSLAKGDLIRITGNGQTLDGERHQ